MRNSRGDGKYLLGSFSCVPAFLIVIRASLEPK